MHPVMTNPASSPDFDFDEWRLLAERDPEAFERRRSQCLEAVIAQAPEYRQARLRGLLWQIDCRRRRAGSAMATCLDAHRLLLDSVYGPRGLQACLNGQWLNGNLPESAEVVGLHKGD